MKSRKMRWAEDAVRLGEKTNAYKVLIRKYEVKTSFGTFTSR
jgi:hypothetical protein